LIIETGVSTVPGKTGLPEGLGRDMALKKCTRRADIVCLPFLLS